jgi:Mrp family chromosome partitioning ATPase/capsular polysaccharide biosynthesis protein
MNETTNASAMFAPIWRRKWLILAVAILVAVGTYFYYKHQRPTYHATTQIYLGAGAEEQVPITGVSGTKRAAAPEGNAQALLINSPIVRSAVRKELRTKKPKTKAERAALAGKVKAKAQEKSEFITVTSEARNAKGASLLADLTAQTYVARQNAKYRHAVEGAIALARRQLRRIEAAGEARALESASSTSKKGAKAKPTGKGSSASTALQVANLSSKINQLESDLGIVSVKQLQNAHAEQLSASPKKNAIFGFVVGLLLASFLAYALARIDNRLGSLEDVEEVFGLEMLTVLPAVRHPIVNADGQSRPSNQLLEPLQRLYANLQVASVGPPEARRRPRVILFTGAASGDGVSTLAADLALVQRDAGAAVALVEADLRRPTIARLLRVSGHPGLVEVLEGSLTIDEAIQGVGSLPAVAGGEAGSHAEPAATVVQAPVSGSAAVLVGRPTPNPAAVLGSAAMAETLRRLAEEFDYVLVDAPPPLEVGDAIPLMHLVDGIVTVARVGQTRAIAARRLMQMLARTPSAPLLGVVANGVSPKDIARHGFSTPSRRSLRNRIAGQ